MSFAIQNTLLVSELSIFVDHSSFWGWLVPHVFPVSLDTWSKS
jgi:hypothetical protein